MNKINMIEDKYNIHSRFKGYVAWTATRYSNQNVNQWTAELPELTLFYRDVLRTV
jgi:hypothetical protein